MHLRITGHRRCLQMSNMDKDVKSRDTRDTFWEIGNILIELQTSIHFSPGDRGKLDSETSYLCWMSHSDGCEPPLINS